MDQDYNYLEQYTYEILFDPSFSFHDNSLFYHTSFAEFCTSNENLVRLYKMLKLHLEHAGDLERISMLRFVTTIPRKLFKDHRFPDIFSSSSEIELPER